MMRGAVRDYPNVEVDFFDGLTVKYAKEHGAKALIRGLRAVTDFEYEFQLSAGNAYVDPSIEMVFFMAGKEMSFISSSMVNELEESGVDVSDLVPPSVIEAYKKSK
jgi:pantetheine-phosphate adenylyltransferase